MRFVVHLADIFSNVYKLIELLLLKQLQVYPMSAYPRGYMLIVNIKNFDYRPHKTRIGSEKDVSKLIIVGRTFGFEIVEAHEVSEKVRY